MGIFDTAQSFLNRGMAATERGTRLVSLKAQLGGVDRDLERAYAALGESLYAALRDDASARAGREPLFDAVAAFVSQREDVLGQIAEVESQAQAAREAASAPDPSAPCYCIACGARVEPGQRFCQACGAPLPGAVASAAGGVSQDACPPAADAAFGCEGAHPEARVATPCTASVVHGMGASSRQPVQPGRPEPVYSVPGAQDAGQVCEIVPERVDTVSDK